MLKDFFLFVSKKNIEVLLFTELKRCEYYSEYFLMPLWRNLLHDSPFLLLRHCLFLLFCRLDDESTQSNWPRRLPRRLFLSLSVLRSLFPFPPSALIERVCTVGAERKKETDNDTRLYCVENPDLSSSHTYDTHVLPLPLFKILIYFKHMVENMSSSLAS